MAERPERSDPLYDTYRAAEFVSEATGARAGVRSPVIDGEVVRFQFWHDGVIYVATVEEV